MQGAIQVLGFTFFTFLQHAYHKIITEELVAFVNKLSVVLTCSEIAALICFVREQRG